MRQAPSYREHADRLISEVKEMFDSMSTEDGELMSPLNDLIQRLSMVDSVERLGIDRHFKNDIKGSLDYVDYVYRLFSHLIGGIDLFVLHRIKSLQLTWIYINLI